MQSKQVAIRPFAELFDQMPPQELDADRAALGSLLLDPSLLDRFPGLLQANDFYADGHRKLFKALVSTQAERSAAWGNGEGDVVILTDRLKERGDYEGVGGAVAIAEIVQKTPVSAHYPYYARIVRRFAARRYALLMTMDALQATYDPHTDPVAWCRAQLKRLGKMEAWLKERGIEEQTE